MKSPLVTIITPLYNCEQYLQETFYSVINQTFKNFEWIIVDDCSTDGSLDLAKRLAEVDKRIVVFSSEKNGGSAKARNFGLKIAKGKYITFLDSDDLLDKNYLEKQISFINENGPIVTSSYRMVSANSSDDFIVPRETNYKSLLKSSPISCLTTMYDREVIGDVFFPENLSKAEDYVFWLSILKCGFVAKGNTEILATYRIVKNSKSRNKLKLIKPMFYVYHKTQQINWFKSWFCVFRWAVRGLKKYRKIK